MKEPSAVDVYDGDFPFQDLWYCDPPERGRPFIVLRAEWSNDYASRMVYEWKYVDAGTG